MDTDPFEDIVPELCQGAAALLDRTFERSPGDFEMIYHVGGGYAIPNPEDTPYIRELARTEGILLDPVYTGKAWAGMAETQDRIAPCHQPKIAAFAKVIKNAGSGAITL